MQLLQDQDVPYIYDADSGSVRVPETSVDQLRAELLSKGYPKSGFAYDMYISNTGLMTTESDKKQYTLYDLQDRLGATIRLFDGVRDAKVTIAGGTEQTYALEAGTSTETGASAVVTMKDGQSLSEQTADAIRNLITHSVRGMNFTDVSVFDAASMKEVGSSGTEDSSGTSTAELTARVEENLSDNIRRVLAKLYGMENIAVSVKGTLNMEKLIQENTQYSVPDKQSAEDKSGLLQHEELTGEITGSPAQSASGVAGADANADTPRYTTQSTDAGTVTESYQNSTAARDWLYNILKEQREISPGVLQEATVAVVINTQDRSIQEAALVNLIADAAGIPREEASDRITVLRAAVQTEASPAPVVPSADAGQKTTFPYPALVGAVASGTMLLLLLLILFLRSRRARRAEQQERAQEELLRQEQEEARERERQQARQTDISAELENGMKLKQAIGEFSEQNPQAVAKLLQSWIREEDIQNGRKQYRSTRKS